MAGSRAPAAGMRSRNSSRGCTGWPRRRGATPRRCPPRCSAPPPEKGTLREYEEAGIDRAVIEIPDEGPDEILRVLDRYQPLLA